MSRLPERIERDYEAFRARIMHDLTRVAVPKLKHVRRTDAEDDPQLLEMAKLLGLTAAALIDRNKLRAKLRRIGKRLSNEKRAQISRLLGRWVPEPHEAIIEQWALNQARAIGEQADEWLRRAAQRASLGTEEELIALSGAAAASRARQRASAAVLALNTELLGNASQLAGVRSYRWVAVIDDVTRDHHADLDGTIQSWDNPPIGGGTTEDEPGHPGSGHGCRCIAEPVVLPS